MLIQAVHPALPYPGPDRWAGHAGRKVSPFRLLLLRQLAWIERGSPSREPYLNGHNFRLFHLVGHRPTRSFPGSDT